MSSITIHRIEGDQLPEYARISIAFMVESVFAVDVVDGGLGGIGLREDKVAQYAKDADSYDEGGPEAWHREFDISEWGLFVAVCEGRWVGGAAVAVDAPGVSVVHGRGDVAVLWDLRMQPEHRRNGVGTRLFEHAAAWARDNGYKQLRIETQNVNVPACRFYMARGCELGVIDRFFYEGHPNVGHEVMLAWHLNLS
ncbi:MAG: GNAT family N-acetyltransferase [SAR202 cluster bacterium]|nr:GNAT family N-acetyltransferase [SAR202 cluster bacterium]